MKSNTLFQLEKQNTNQNENKNMPHTYLMLIMKRNSSYFVRAMTYLPIESFNGISIRKHTPFVHFPCYKVVSNFYINKAHNMNPTPINC